MPSYLDLGVIAIVLISAVLAMVRGFTREVLAIASWGAAAVAAIYFHPLVLPFVKPYISKDTIALAVAAAIVFFATLIIVSIITVKISDAILDSKVGPLDRSLGFVFGAAARAFALRHRLCVLQLAGAGEDPARLGQGRQAETASAVDRRRADGDAAGRSGGPSEQAEEGQARERRSRRRTAIRRLPPGAAPTPGPPPRRRTAPAPCDTFAHCARARTGAGANRSRNSALGLFP